MKLAFKFYLIFAVHTATIYSDQVVTLIGSHLLPADSNFKTFLSTNNLDGGSSVDVSLTTSNGPTNKNVRMSAKDTFDEVQFERLPQSNDYELKVAPKSSNKCSSAKLIKTSDRPIIFIQYTKPFYKIGDDFSFRIFALNQKMLPYSGRQSINVKILDSKNKVIEKFDNIETLNFGVYENKFKLSDSENLGKWKIQVESADRKITKKFNVEQANPDNLEIYIEMVPMLAYLDRKAFMNIYVKDRSNKFFTGTAKIYVSGSVKGSSRVDFNRKLVKTLDLVGHKNGVGISFDEEIGLSPPSDMNLKFDVEVTDPATQRSIKASKNVELKSNSRNTIHLVKKKFFKPGFKYPMKVKVKTLDGAPDNSFNKLSMTVEYHNKGSGIDKKEFQMNLKNGEISAPLNPTADTTQITVNLAFVGASLTEVIKPLPTMGANEYMQVSLLKKGNAVGDTAKYQVQATQEMESLHVLLIGLNGIVHYEEFPDAMDKDIFEFSIELTEEMKPESRGIAFYIRPSDGVLIYDEFVLSLTFGIENLLEISAPETGKPSEQINLDFKTLKGSKVFLTASDQISPQLVRDNEISRSDIYNELIFYLNYRFPNTSLYNFEKFNGFILQPLSEGQTCGRESARYTNIESDEEDEATTDVKYFPNVWFDKSFDASSDSATSVPVKLPNSLTTWRYYGISVHPTKGFTVAKVQPKTAVQSEIVAQVKAPPSAYESEVVWVDINVFNTLPDRLQSDVFVSIENGFIVDLKDNVEFNLKCTKFTTRNQKDVKLSSNLQPQKKTEVKTIPIKSNGNGDMKVKVRAAAGSYNDEATKTIMIEQAQDPAHTDNNFEAKVNTQALPNNQAKIEIEGKVLRQDVTQSSIIVLDVELPRGFKYAGHEQNDKIEDVDLHDDSSVTFYLKNLRPNQNFRQSIKVSKVYDFDNHKPSVVTVYDYKRPDSKSISYYSYDKNTDACDRIEVIRWTNKAKDAQEITQEAQRAVQKSRGKVEQAQQILTNAQTKLKQAEENVKIAEQKALEADQKSQDAFAIAEDAWGAAEQAKQYKLKNVVVTNPSNSIEEPAQETATTAAEAQRLAKEAQHLADQAQDDAANAEDDVTRANDDVEAAKAEVQKALKALTDAQMHAHESKDEAENLQKDAMAAKGNVGDAQNKVKTVQKDTLDAQRAVNAAADEVNKIQNNVDDALAVVNDAVNKANKATRYTDIELDILNAEKVSQNAQTLAQNANRVEKGVIQKVQQPVTAINQEWDNVQKLQTYCNSIFARATTVNNGAMNVQKIITVSTVSFKNGQKHFEDARKNFAEAQIKAQLTNDRATRLREYAQAKSIEARKLEAQEQATQRTTTKYTTRIPTYWQGGQGSWQDSQRRTTQGRIYTTTQPTRQDNVYYPPQSVNHEVSSVQESSANKCSKWYRFCNVGF
ncbi:unnamed protein product [Chironomus riparius]|uniref:Uncharacterized protein n=1 Tax=Chironomus riparius TaxID=315576 RepID=A0A9N9S2U4_9DIPT|nr:unnamed protein product [Chironomus riparius]